MTFIDEIKTDLEFCFTETDKENIYKIINGLEVGFYAASNYWELDLDYAIELILENKDTKEIETCSYNQYAEAFYTENKKIKEVLANTGAVPQILEGLPDFNQVTLYISVDGGL